MPGPESERNAIDVVIQYAVEVLGFSVSNIVIYAWSIGECSHHFFCAFCIQINCVKFSQIHSYHLETDNIMSKCHSRQNKTLLLMIWLTV